MRRPIRRPFRPRRAFPARRPPIAQPALARLRRAHQLMERGDFLAAAAIFAELADGAERRGIPRGAQLHFQAARAYLKAGDEEHTRERITRGIDLLERTGQMERLAVLGPRIVAELREHGLTEDAEALEKRLADLPVVEPMTGAAGKTASLPTKCGSCGGTIRPDEVEFLDAHSAVCSYCGSVLQRE